MEKLLKSKNKNQNKNEKQNENKKENPVLFSCSFLFLFSFLFCFYILVSIFKCYCGSSRTPYRLMSVQIVEASQQGATGYFIFPLFNWRNRMVMPIFTLIYEIYN